MNDIVFAGRTENAGAESVGKYTEIISVNGRGRIIWESGSAGFASGDILVIPALTKRRIVGAGEGDICVRLDRALVALTEPTVLKDDRNRGAAHACAQAAYYFGRAEGGAVLVGLGALLAGYAAAFSRNEEYSPAVAAVKREIDRRLSDVTFALDDFIRKMPLSYDYVRKLFRKETGVTPHEYLVSSRMSLAADIISSGISNRYSGYSVSQIAEACGYSEPLYFSRVFKKYYGISPSEYRGRG